MMNEIINLFIRQVKRAAHEYDINNSTQKLRIPFTTARKPPSTLRDAARSTGWCSTNRSSTSLEAPYSNALWSKSKAPNTYSWKFRKWNTVHLGVTNPHDWKLSPFIIISSISTCGTCYETFFMWYFQQNSISSCIRNYLKILNTSGYKWGWYLTKTYNKTRNPGDSYFPKGWRYGKNLRPRCYSFA